jgi:hypothetical protein
MKRIWLFLPFLILFAPHIAGADPITIDFEGYSDGDSVGSSIPGFVFFNATVLSSGVSLNQFEFPPHSGINVVFDDGGPLTIDFGFLVSSFSAYFTYAEPLTLGAFDASSNLVASAFSSFGSNLALSGDPGSSPNELLQLTDSTGFNSVAITGDPAGGSFVMDDVSVSAAAAATQVPEPSSLALLLLGIGFIAVFGPVWRRRSARLVV